MENKYQVGRGTLHADKQKALDKMRGKEVTRRELRLYPYIQYCSYNSSNIERSRVNAEETAILNDLKAEGLLKTNRKGCLCFSAKFRNIINFAMQWAYEGQ